MDSHQNSKFGIYHDISNDWINHDQPTPNESGGVIDQPDSHQAIPSCARTVRFILVVAQHRRGPEKHRAKGLSSRRERKTHGEFTWRFPSCQVTAVRFYQSCSPPPPPPPPSSSASCPPPPPPRPPPPPPLVSPRPCLHLLPPPLPPNQLFAKLFANSLRQALCQLPSSVCTGTSTWDLPSSVCTAGPQAQCAPLDLNQGPSQLSVHSWTSTWDLPSPVCTAGPQPGICPAQCAQLDLNRGPPQLSVHCWTSTGR